jgi:hypothetical protein
VRSLTAVLWMVAGALAFFLAAFVAVDLMFGV